MSKRHARRKGSATASGAKTAPALVILLTCLAALTALTAADRALQLGLLRSPLALQLSAAAEAVMEEPTRQEKIALDVGKEAVVVSLPPRYDRVEAVRLALELEAMRAQCERTIAHLKTLDYLDAEAEQQAEDAAMIAALWGGAEERLAGFITVEPERARIILAALGWSWLGDGPEAPETGEIDMPLPRRPTALQGTGRADWFKLLAEAKARRPWPELASDLAARYGLSSKQLRTLQAYLCWTDVQAAFHSRRAYREAQRTLEQHAALAPAQVRTVLAMAGAQELLEAGTFAFPPLIDVLERQPDLGLPLLHECVIRTAVREQAQRAAGELGGPASSYAESTLVALGPFGADAVKAAQGSAVSRPAQQVLSAIAADWPEGASALDALGKDAALWRRWYRRAREVL